MSSPGWLPGSSPQVEYSGARFLPYCCSTTSHVVSLFRRSKWSPCHICVQACEKENEISQHMLTFLLKERPKKFTHHFCLYPNSIPWPLSTVLVCYGCHNKESLIERFKQQKCICLTILKDKSVRSRYQRVAFLWAFLHSLKMAAFSGVFMWSFL